MRVLFLTWRDLAHPQAGGSEVLVDRLACGLLERGHEPAVLCGGPVAPRPYPILDAGGTILGGEALQPTTTATSIRADIVTDGRVSGAPRKDFAAARTVTLEL